MKIDQVEIFPLINQNNSFYMMEIVLLSCLIIINNRQVNMNIYNLNDFKCCLCSKWFHPKNALPFMLPCTHSLCNQCLTMHQKSHPHKQYIECPKHLTRQSLINIKLNEHILQALQRLLKNNKDQSCETQLKQQTLLLDKLIDNHKQDTNDFVQLLNRIYSNQIKRLDQLRKRVKQQIKDPIAWVAHWKELIQNCKDQREVIDEGRQLEKKIRQFYEINLQKIAQQVIANPSLCLKRHFSIYDLIEKEQQLPRKTLKSSIIPNYYQNRKNSFNQKYINKQGQQNISLNFIKHVESPQFRQQLKQLNSFKLETSRLADTTEDIGETTHRDCQRSKCSLKTKVAHVEKQNIKINEDNKMSFVDLIYSLKCSDQGDPLQYSPEPVIDEMLLSEAKDEKVNFLKQWEMPKPQTKKEVEIRRKQFICSDKENNKYIKRMETVRTAEAQAATSLANNTLELFNFDLKEVDLTQYLDQFDWQKIEVIKLVATGLQDAHFNQLLNYLINTKVHTLLLPSNELEQISLDALIYFTEMNSHLRTVSLQKNNIQTLSSKTRSKLNLLRQKGVKLYI